VRKLEAATEDDRTSRLQKGFFEAFIRNYSVPARRSNVLVIMMDFPGALVSHSNTSPAALAAFRYPSRQRHYRQIAA
jgi:hypothetical protein